MLSGANAAGAAQPRQHAPQRQPHGQTQQQESSHHALLVPQPQLQQQQQVPTPQLRQSPQARALPVRRQPLKSKSRRSLSAFYASKSQSFDCIKSLGANPFARSALALAKQAPADAMDSWRGDQQLPPFMAGLPAAPLASHPLARRSWDGSDSEASTPFSRCQPPSSCSFDAASIGSADSGLVSPAGGPSPGPYGSCSTSSSGTSWCGCSEQLVQALQMASLHQLPTGAHAPAGFPSQGFVLLGGTV